MPLHPDTTTAQRALHTRGPEWTALSLYAALVAFAIPYHEPWADEAQAWQLARSLSLSELFHTYIRFEASPGLWHFILWILVHLHVGYAGMHWFCGVMALSATALLIFKAPFPRYLRLSLPFTFFLLYQYAVVARNYVLVPVLLFLIAWYWKKSPALPALLLGLLANVALHAAAISGGLAIVYCIEQIRSGALKDPSRRRQLLLFSVVLLCFYSFALWTAWPPKELSQHLSIVRGEAVSVFAWISVALLWGIWQPWALSIVFWIAIALCLHSRRCLYYLLPVLFFALFSAVAHPNWWHAGLLVPLLIALLWITWPAPGAAVGRREAAGRIAMVLLAVVQIAWAVNAIQYDHYNAFSPDLAVARYLKPYVQQNTHIAITYWDEPRGHAFGAIGILPYFDRNIFVNLPDPYWSWDNRNPTEDRCNAILPSHPKIVLVETSRPGPNQPTNLFCNVFESMVLYWYCFVGSFCGARPETIGVFRSGCHVVFEYPGASPNPQTPAPAGR